MGIKPAAIDSPEGSFISAAEAIRTYPGLNRAKLYHMGLTGSVGVKLLPGIPPRYSAEDLARVTNSRRAMPAGV